MLKRTGITLQEIQDDICLTSLQSNGLDFNVCSTAVGFILQIFLSQSLGDHFDFSIGT